MGLFIVMLIVDLKLGMLLGLAGYGIASKYKRSESPKLCAVLGFFAAATRIFELFWPIPLVGAWFAWTLATSWWSRTFSMSGGTSYGSGYNHYDQNRRNEHRPNDMRWY
jgi:hypothetical protein